MDVIAVRKLAIFALLLLLSSVVMSGCGNKVSAPSPSLGSDSFVGIREVDEAGVTVQEWAIGSLGMIQPIWVEHSEDRQLLVYGKDHQLPQIVQVDGRLASMAPLNWDDEEKRFGNDYGIDYLFADRILNDEAFVVLGNRTLYLADVKTGVTQKLYSSELPVYGIAASPDNRLAALLVATEKTLTPSADLIVIDRNGQIVYSKKQASYAAHSDGFLFVYPMVWTDSHSVAVLRIGNAAYGDGGVDIVDISSDTVSFHSKTVITKTALEHLEKAAGQVQFPNELRILTGLGDKSNLEAIDPNARHSLWLLNTETGEVKTFGPGMLLKWTSNGHIQYAKSNPEDQLYYIGLDDWSR